MQECISHNEQRSQMGIKKRHGAHGEIKTKINLKLVQYI